MKTVRMGDLRVQKRTVSASTETLRNMF
jgi:hypothetical protein